MGKPKCCKRLCKPKMKDGENPFKGESKSKGFTAWVIGFLVLACVGAGIIPYVQETKEYGLSYTAPKLEHLINKQPGIEITGIDFQSELMKDRLQKLASQMTYICDERTEDVVFAFQFSSNKRQRNDHIFSICSSKLTIGNAKILTSSDDFIMCTEEFADKKRMVKRSSSVIIKAIDIEEWEVIEYATADAKEACVVQHAIDVTNSQWL